MESAAIGSCLYMGINYFVTLRFNELVDVSTTLSLDLGKIRL